ncbi:MAG: hypothetical protein DHS20C14_00630 [Phycisphaeraceae bacterium]|nr:MAG: hypothetical protein DHS20C14_00630 [Phycisphaeraceae bacterium]
MTTPIHFSLATRRALAGAAMIALAGTLGGCGDDAASQAINQADIEFQRVSAGPAAPDEHARTVYGGIETLLTPFAGEGSKGEGEAASVMLSSAQQGLAAAATSEAADLEFEVRSQARVILAHGSEWSRLNALAEAAASYDPAPELADLDEALRETRAELSVLEEKQHVAEGTLTELNTQIDELRQRSETARSAAGELQLEMSLASSSRAVELAPRIRDLLLEADRLELDARRVDTTREQFLPEANEINLNIARVEKQRELLTRSRTETNARGRAAEEDEQRLRAAAREASSRLAAKVSELEEFRKTDVADAFDRAIRQAHNAAANARGGKDTARDSGTVATALSNQSKGLLQMRRAQMNLGISRTYESLSLLGLPDYTRLSEEAMTEAQDSHEAAVTSLDTAVGAMRRLRVPGDLGDRIKSAADMLERYAQTPLGEAPNLAEAPEPIEDDAGFDEDFDDEPSFDEPSSSDEDEEG